MRYEIEMCHAAFPNTFFAYMEIMEIGSAEPEGDHRAWEYQDDFIGSTEAQTQELAEIQARVDKFAGLPIYRVKTIKEHEYHYAEINDKLNKGFGREFFVQYTINDFWYMSNAFLVGATEKEEYFILDGTKTPSGEAAIISLNRSVIKREGHHKIGQFLCEPIKQNHHTGRAQVRNFKNVLWLLRQVSGRNIEHFYPAVALKCLQTATDLPFTLLNELDAAGCYKDKTAPIRFGLEYKDDPVPTYIELFTDSNSACGWDAKFRLIK